MRSGPMRWACWSSTLVGRSCLPFPRRSSSPSRPARWSACRRLRLRADYFGIVTIAFSEIVRYVFQNAAFAGGNQGVIGYDAEWRAFQAWASEQARRRSASAGRRRLPLLIAVWAALLLCLAALKALQLSPWGRVLKAIREDEDAAAALGKNVFAFKLQSLGIAAALAAIAGFFLALNVTYLYPSEFDPSFTFFGYAVLILGGFASYGGVVVGAVRPLRADRGPALPRPAAVRRARRARCDSSSSASILICLSMFRPQGPARQQGRDAACAHDGDPNAGEPILAVSDVTKSFGGLRAVDRASFAVARGSITALIGPNGAGKTTLFDLISGYERPDLRRRAFRGAPHRRSRQPPRRAARRSCAPSS